ncbi:MAG: oligosaccharide flippase family protein [Rubrivivax sp.]|nr:oligosaccharide flippase family protein [Rubrivivax sp.]
MSRQLGRSVLIYACAFAVAGATPFVLLPVLTRTLNPAEFGQVTAFLMLAAIIANAAGLSVHGLVSVRYFKVDREELRRLVSAALLLVLAAHAVALLAVLALQGPLARYLELSTAAGALAVAAALALSVNGVCLALFQSSDRPLHYLAARLIQGAVELGLCLALLRLLLPDAGARTTSYTAALLASAAFGLAVAWRHGHLGPAALSTRRLRALLAFGAPMLPHVAAGTAITYLDRMVVSSLLGAPSLGLYMAAMQIGMVMIALVEPLNKALAPWLFRQLARNDEAVRRMIVRRTYGLFVALALVGVVLAAAAWLLFERLVGAAYAEARPLVPWMVAGFVLQGMYYAVVNYLFFAERTGRLSATSSTVAVVGVGVSTLLTSQWGLVGAAVSFTVNNALLLLLVWAVAAASVPMPWRLRR